jgi:pimeloyl-ACP methyl ester carboxylesterase
MFYNQSAKNKNQVLYYLLIRLTVILLFNFHQLIVRAVFSILCIFFTLSNQVFSQTEVNYGSDEQAGKYIDIDDIKIYYEIYGEGEPVLLLHGNGGSIENFLKQIPEFSEYFKVIAIDSRAQGRSTDSEKEITYELMASDMAALIDKLNLGSVNVVGWSDGGIIGLELAYLYPDKVKKLVAVGANYSNKNFIAPSDHIHMDARDTLVIRSRKFAQRYRNTLERLSPNPEKIPEIRRKLRTLMAKYPNFTVKQLQKIKTPTLVVSGDHDIISLDHTVSLFASLPHAQLFVVPDATHVVPVEQPDLFNSVVLNFLKTPYRDIDRYYFFR